MFSFTPYNDSQFYPQSSYSYRRPHTSSYVPAAYARAVAAERERERIAAARRLAAEQEARARLARFGYQGDDDEGYGLPFGLGPRDRAYLEAKREQEAVERARIMEARKLREAELRAQRERERRAAVEQFYRGLGLRVPDEEQVEDDNSNTPELEPESNIQTPTSRARSASPTTSQPTANSTTSAPTPTTRIPTPEEREAAANKIQNFYRMHLSLRTISSLQSKFETLKADFELPSSVDFIATDGSVITLSQNSNTIPSGSTEGPYNGAKLAFTPTNVPIRAYDEELNRILAKLDAVESWGVGMVRERRKAVVRAVEEEAAKVEAAWTNLWKEYVEREESEKMDEVEVEAVVDEDEKMDQGGVEESSACEPSTVESVEDVPSSNLAVESAPIESELFVDAEDSMMDTTANTFISGPSSSTPTPTPATTVTEPCIDESAVASHSDDADAALEEPKVPVHLPQCSHSESSDVPTTIHIDTQNPIADLDDSQHSETESESSEMESNDSDYESVGSISELEGLGGAEQNDESEDGNERNVDDFVML